MSLTPLYIRARGQLSRIAGDLLSAALLRLELTTTGMFDRRSTIEPQQRLCVDKIIIKTRLIIFVIKNKLAVEGC